MRSALEDLLCRRYPELYGPKDAALSETAMHWGFETVDGWWSIIDALSATLTKLEADIEIKQVKEKFATLRFDTDVSSAVAMAAIEIACAFSGRICEETGQPGEVGMDGGWYRTLSPEAWAEKGRDKRSIERFYSDHESNDSWPPHLPRLERRLTFTREQAVAELRKRHPQVLVRSKVFDIPPKAFDLADVALHRMSQRRHDDPHGAVVQIEEIYWNVDEGLTLLPWFPSIRPVALAKIARDRHNWEKLDRPFDEPSLRDVITEIADELRGAAYFAQEMGKSIEMQTGRCGPVNDRGNIIHRLPAYAGEAADRLANTRQVTELLHAFCMPNLMQPVVVARRSVKLTMEARHIVAQKIRTRGWTIIAPRVYAYGSLFSVQGDLPSAYHAAVGLAQQYRWRLMLPVEMSRFFMGRIPRPDPTEINIFHYDQPEVRHYEKLGLTLKPVPDPRALELNAAGQVIWHHVHQQPAPTNLELLRDANFAAAAWFSNATLSNWLMEAEKSGRLDGKELFLARAIIAASTEDTGVADKAPADFDPAAHEATAARIYGWSIQEHKGSAYLVAQAIENHPHLPDGKSLGTSTALVWADLSIGWARTRSRYYRLMGHQRT